MTIENQNFTMYDGDTKRLRVTVVDEAGAAFNLTGGSAAFALFTSSGRTAVVTKNVAGGGITLTDPVNGILTVNLNPADTDGFAQGKYFYAVLALDASGREATVTTGAITLKSNRTAATTVFS